MQLKWQKHLVRKKWKKNSKQCLYRIRQWRRVADLSQHVSCELKTHISKCSYFSLALNESVDVTDISQLMIFARPMGENFDFHVELLAIYPLTGGTKEYDIYIKH